MKSRRTGNFKMKISDFKRVSNALTKTTHAFLLCFDKIEVNDASASYDGCSFSLSLECYVEDFGINRISCESSGDDASLVVNKFYQGLIFDIDSNFSELKDEEKKDDKDWNEWRIYSHEYSNLPRIASLEMLKDILLGFKR